MEQVRHNIKRWVNVETIFRLYFWGYLISWYMGRRFNIGKPKYINSEPIYLNGDPILQIVFAVIILFSRPIMRKC